mmetsp:Transcript_17192/g.66912  ORF Transcript_17192/g.66912 Transcript_17192/m.66912 type:complete len:247 (+) Transcript_17192:52-792(+)
MLRSGATALGIVGRALRSGGAAGRAATAAHRERRGTEQRRSWSSSSSRLAPLGWDVPEHQKVRATTILTVRKGGKVVMIGDGQVSLGNTVVKPNAKKVRRLQGDIVTGIAGATGDAITLFERLEQKLGEYPGQLLRSCVELGKMWRSDKYLRRLEAVMLVADSNVSLMLSGTGDVLEPAPHGVIAIGSGGAYAQAAAVALLDTDWDAERIARRAMEIAADTCVFTNHTFVVEVIDFESGKEEKKSE